MIRLWSINKDTSSRWPFWSFLSDEILQNPFYFTIFFLSMNSSPQKVFLKKACLIQPAFFTEISKTLTITLNYEWWQAGAETVKQHDDAIFWLSLVINDRICRMYIKNGYCWYLLFTSWCFFLSEAIFTICCWSHEDLLLIFICQQGQENWNFEQILFETFKKS